MTHVAIADYGLGNLHSVRRALEAAGATATITSEPDALGRADAIVVPGVGAFGRGIRNLEERGLGDAIKVLARSGVPTLGICLGMQLLVDASEELGTWQGLGLVSGRVIGFRPGEGDAAKVPQIGWNTVELPRSNDDWTSPLMDGIEPGAFMYFVHSFAVVLDEPTDMVGQSHYAGLRFCSVLARDNVFGCQFHPEKSGGPGLRLIANFLRLAGRR